MLEMECHVYENGNEILTFQAQMMPKCFCKTAWTAVEMKDQVRVYSNAGLGVYITPCKEQHKSTSP